MRVIPGKVVDGRIELPPGEVPDGTDVAVVLADESEPFTLSAQDERELLERLDSIREGNFVDGDEFLRTLKSRHGA